MGYRRLRKSEGSLALLEQKGALRILLYIYSHNESMITHFIDNIPGLAQTSVYTALNKLIVLELVEEEYKHPYNRRIFKLTEKGLSVAKHLQKIQELISNK